MAESVALLAKNLVKSFGSLRAVDGLDLAIPEGTLYGLIGPNGAGKTTFIKMALTLLKPDSGAISILGMSPAEALKRGVVGYMPQDIALYTDLSVQDNLNLFAEIYGLEPKAINERSERLLELVGLSERRGSRVENLSGGMMHRASLACALISDPQVLFLDEPTVGVDPELRSEFWSYFNNLRDEGKTIVITTHYMDEARNCDVVGLMYRGKIIAEGSVESVMARAGADNLEDAFLHYVRHRRDE